CSIPGLADFLITSLYLSFKRYCSDTYHYRECFDENITSDNNTHEALTWAISAMRILRSVQQRDFRPPQMVHSIKMNR
ncbi:MAG: hypothetical protein ACFFE4_15390, partial [Candidatus Thorarchaeota archaeon]